LLVRTSFRFWIRCRVPEIFAVKVGSGPKLTEILHVFGPNFFGGSTPEFVELDYKIQPDSDHVAKFQGDRSTELGERLAKQKNIWGKTEARPELIVPGGLNGLVKLFSAKIVIRVR